MTYGVTIIRFKNEDVLHSTDEVIEKIRQKIIELREIKIKKKPKSS